MKRARNLRSRLQAAEETLRAIRAGEVDGVVAESGAGVITLAGVDLAYRILFDQMNEGAVTLTDRGRIAYCNGRFAHLMRTPMARLIGAPLRRFVAPAERRAFDTLLAAGLHATTRAEGTLHPRRGGAVPVSVSFAPLQRERNAEVIGLIGVVTDISARVMADAARAQLVSQAMASKEEERRRIAQELHDETGQSLTALLVGLRAIEESRTSEEAAALARRLRAIAAQTLDEVGRLARGLHPGVLEELGLGAAVALHAQEFGRAHNLTVDVRFVGLDGEILPPAVQSTLYRGLQEALTNVTKHAAAGRVEVRLTRNATGVELHVRDDGSGFDPEQRRASRSGGRRRLGLQGMRERAALLGGTVAVTSRRGAGTTVTARYPLAKPGTAAS